MFVIRGLAFVLAALVLCPGLPGASGQEKPSPTPLNIIAFGAHPDDCDIRAGGTAAKWAAAGHRVRFVSVTNGDAGHQIAGRRRAGGAAPGGGAGGRPPRRRRLRRARQPRRRADARR